MSTALRTLSLSAIAASIVITGVEALAEPKTVVDANHVVVRKPDPGRAFGWPANGGIWSWGNEILVMYLDCPYKDNPGFSNHDSEQSHSSSKWVTSRSLDGGETWGDHRVVFPALGVNAPGVKPTTLATPIAFDDPDTIVNFHWDGLAAGARTYLYYSTDRGRTWHGPYDNIPLFDAKAVTGRTDYEVTGKHSLTAWFSCTDEETEDCYRGSTYAFTTSDGGITWQKGPRTSREPSPCGSKYRGMDLPLATKMEYGHMPSTVRLDANTLVATFRSGDAPGGNFRAYGFPFRDGWIDVTRSTDNGKTWRPLGGHLMDMPTLNSSPPALSRLPSGRLVCSWGYRLPDDGSGPTAIQARTSDDNGATWGDTITLRHDGFDYDIGYNRQVVRPDGKVVTVYYYRTKADGQSPTYIAATVWTPLAAPTRGTAARSPAFYYVDAVNGDNNNTGASLDQAWRTLQKAADAMASGDTAYVRAGTYRETVTPRAGQTFVAADGERAEVTGCDLVAGWRRADPGRPVYVAEVGTEVRAVFFRGKAMDLARHPNHAGDRLVTDSWARVVVSEAGANRTARVEFEGETWETNQWTGGVFVGVGGENGYSANCGVIASSSRSGLRITRANFYLRNAEFQGPGHGYITRHLRALDAPGEWHWENGRLYFWPPGGETPPDDAVEAQVRLWGFDLTGREHVIVRGFHFRGASALLEDARDCVVERCVFRHHAPWGFDGGEDLVGERHAYRFGLARNGTSGLHVSGAGNVVRDCSLTHAWGGGVSLLGERNTLENCRVEEVGWLAFQDLAPVWLCGDGHRIEGCTIRRAAGMGICATQFGARLVKRPMILRNRISDVGLLLVDGGSSGIYLSNHDASTEDRSLAGGVVAWNHISGVQVARGNKGFGIYLDDGTDHAVIHHNVVHGGGRLRWGIFIHYATHFSDDIGVFHNTVWGVREQAIFAGGRTDVGGTRGFVCRNNLVQRGAIATVRGEITSSHNCTGAVADEFLDVEAIDFRLRSQNSPAVNAGVAIPGINDGIPDGRPDLGAYEYNSVNWTAGSTITAPPAFPNE